MSYGECHACLSPLIVGNLVVCEGHTLPGHSTVENSDENMERRWFSKRAKSLKYEGIRLILNGMRLASIESSIYLPKREEEKKRDKLYFLLYLLAR